MTHFATADEPGDDHFQHQLDRFTPFADELREAREDLLVHAANSAATYRDEAAHFDMVRCGIAIYGLDPFHEDPGARGLEPALRLESYVAAVRRFEPGDSAGYGRRWQRRAADLGRDAADRVRRRLAARAHEQRRRARRADGATRSSGTVSMDNITIDLGPETDVEPGDRAVLIGADGERAHPVRGRRAAPRHDQLRDHLRAVAARPARPSARVSDVAQRLHESAAGAGRARGARRRRRVRVGRRRRGARRDPRAPDHRRRPGHDRRARGRSRARSRRRPAARRSRCPRSSAPGG